MNTEFSEMRWRIFIPYPQGFNTISSMLLIHPHGMENTLPDVLIVDIEELNSVPIKLEEKEIYLCFVSITKFFHCRNTKYFRTFKTNYSKEKQSVGIDRRVWRLVWWHGWDLLLLLPWAGVVERRGYGERSRDQRGPGGGSGCDPQGTHHKHRELINSRKPRWLLTRTQTDSKSVAVLPGPPRESQGATTA